MPSQFRKPLRPGSGPFRPAPFSGDTDTRPRVTAVSPSFDRTAGGAAVSITGQNFGAVDGGIPTVRFGTTAATGVVVVSRTRITCNAPAHAAGLVDVSVTDSHGQVGTLADAFIFVNPQINAITPNHGVLAGGTTIVIEGGNFQAGSVIRFGGVLATAITFIDAQHYSCVTPAHSVGPVQITMDVTTICPVPFFYTLLTRANDIRRNPSIRVTRNLGNAPSTCSFRVDGQSSPPTAGEAVEITDERDGDRVLFQGVALNVDQNYEEIISQLAWDVTCTNYIYWLNRKRPFGTYLNTSVSDIVLDLCVKYAPWVDTSFVQTSLCNVNISFDGTQDFASCLSILARLLGGGHWYLDGKVLHFFHTVGGGGSLGPTQTNPSGVVEDGSGGAQPGIGTAMTVAAGAAVYTFNTSPPFFPGFYGFWSTFVYSNGMESARSLLSNIIFLGGSKFPDLTNIPIGTNPGTLTVVARRIYYFRHLPLYGYLEQSVGIQINDNVTTSLTRVFAPDFVTQNIAVPMTANTRQPSKPVKTPPAGPAVAPGASLGGLSMTEVYAQLGFTGFSDGVHGFVGTAGNWQFAISNVYADGTESQRSPLSAPVTLDGHQSVALTAPIGADLNGVPVRYRRVWGILFQTAYGSFVGDLSGFTAGWWVIPDNTTISTTIGQGFFFEYPTPQKPGDTTNPVDPCDGDGPYLEDTLTQPTAVDDVNVDLLRDPPVTSSVDISQLRNRVYCRGSGTLTTEDAVVGAMSLAIADASALPPNGGYVAVGAQGIQVRIAGVGQTVGAGTIQLLEQLQVDLPSGSAVRGVARADDYESQRMMGKIELDDDGNETDGVHEFYIDDPSLTTYQQQINRAIAELELFGRPTITVNYATRDPNTLPGRKVNFALTYPPLRGEFLIQQVSIDQIHDESDDLRPRYIATASSVKFNLEDLLLMIATAMNGFSTASFSSPGTGASLGTSSKGLVETAIQISSTQTAAALESRFSTSPGSTAGGVTIWGVTKDIDFTIARAMNSAPFLVVPGVAGKIVMPCAVTLEQNIVLAAYSGNWNNTIVHEGLTVALTAILQTSNGAGPRTFWAPFNLTPAGTTDGINVSAIGRGLSLRGSVDVTGGSGSFRISIIYAVIDGLT